MTKTFSSALRSVAFAVTVFCATTAGSTAGHAFSSEAQQMCTGDAFRLCSSDIPNISKITACMIRNRSNLSSGCRTVMDKETAAARKSQTASIQ